MLELSINSVTIYLFGIIWAAEALINYKDNRHLYGLKDSLTNICFGLVVIVAGLGLKLVALIFYEFVYHYRIFELENTLWVWLVAIFACDLIFHLFHFMAHKVNLFWAVHSFHHSSNYFNFTIGLRNHFIHLTYRFLFWSPLCFIGFDPLLIIFIDNFTSFYQLFLHTQLIGKLGPFELFLNTPSHHRVHHGCNEQYLDKNFGGLFIIYDRFFGTFCAEDEPVAYGVTKRSKSENPLKIAFHEFYLLYLETHKKKSLFTKIKILFSNPNNKIY